MEREARNGIFLGCPKLFVTSYAGARARISRAPTTSRTVKNTTKRTTIWEKGTAKWSTDSNCDKWHLAVSTASNVHKTQPHPNRRQEAVVASCPFPKEQV